MSVQADILVDLEVEDICGFLAASDQTYTHPIDENYWLAERGYTRIKGAGRALSEETRELYSWIGTEFEVRSKKSKRKIDTATAWDIAVHNVSLTIVAILLVKKNADNSTKGRLEKAFASYDVASESLAELQASLVQEGIGLDDYQVLLTFALKKQSVDFRKTNAEILRSQLSQNYEVIDQDRSVFLCKREHSYFDDAHRIEVDSIDAADTYLRDYAKALKSKCDRTDVAFQRLGTLLMYREVKIMYVIKEVRVGRCRIAKTRVPVIFTRQCKQALYGYVVAEENALRAVRSGIEKCIRESAIAAAIIWIVSSGAAFKIALIAFESAVFLCIENFVSNDMPCIAADLKLVAERDEWFEGTRW